MVIPEDRNKVTYPRVSVLCMSDIFRVPSPLNTCWKQTRWQPRVVTFPLITVSHDNNRPCTVHYIIHNGNSAVQRRVFQPRSIRRHRQNYLQAVIAYSPCTFYRVRLTQFGTTVVNPGEVARGILRPHKNSIIMNINDIM